MSSNRHFIEDHLTVILNAGPSQLPPDCSALSSTRLGPTGALVGPYDMLIFETLFTPWDPVMFDENAAYKVNLHSKAKLWLVVCGVYD